MCNLYYKSLLDEIPDEVIAAYLADRIAEGTAYPVVDVTDVFTKEQISKKYKPEDLFDESLLYQWSRENLTMLDVSHWPESDW